MIAIGVKDMETCRIQSVEVSVQMTSEEDKEKWAEEHARRLNSMFERWQKPLGIDGEDYRRYLKKELADCCDKPLMKSLIELID